ncbi:uncharacterized protein A4U43_C06F13630, partial [Asparagus officinalis]
MGSTGPKGARKSRSMTEVLNSGNLEFDFVLDRQILQNSGRQGDRSSGGLVLGKNHSSGSNGNLEFNKSAVSSRSIKSWADELDSSKDILDSSLNQDLRLNLKNPGKSPLAPVGKGQKCANIGFGAKGELH